MESPIKQISRVLRSEDDFLVVSHYNPDGDALGSTCAMGHILKALGKQFTLYNTSGVPQRYDFVNKPAEILTELPERLPKWTIVLDCGAKDRMGDELMKRVDQTRIIDIDHHLGNGDYGEINWVDVRQPAVGSMIAELATELEVPLIGGLAECIYLAVATDTGFFSYGSTTPESLELAATMLRHGLDLARMNERITKQWSEERMRLWSEVMSDVQLFADKRVAVGTITQEIFERTGTTSGDTENIINFIRRLKSVRVAAILREEGENCYKFSLRSYGNDNVQEIASQFGGGGHKNASGGTIEAPLDEARELLVSAITAALELD
ncbi:Phosphoesterase RecJ domain protein [Pseudodesulfovibrio profundus]|uniref:Phosphoesterase RecJ domain protein n=1 Tax=Pseudodesulfovibrio profundus TaxID=57320 RepID=A0A2C8F685_9BACT|nr:bifunctional oligoribonuclease/PAP phosphatase NrnA [Pseudodesulfovibrio profundus]MBC18033.1 recombinase RecJ [Desulfovibrio sp.]SOB57635.1 Phosphoesterase RecJ domain protein [Pseudodesulfovibrio profundus]|tara:strand:- start:1820 stop:2788 length:969 start_codon:yes stop_codon:yes gene_type:complete